MVSRAIDLPSPCVSVCTLDSATGYCLGCLRTAGEIAAWRELDFDQRLALLERLRARRREIGLPVRDGRRRRRRRAAASAPAIA